MSVTVRQLNGDSTFLLIFSPQPDPTSSDLRSANGAYSILIDPWIVGSSVTTAPWFAITNRKEPSAISHLSQLDDEPDLVLCSQNKTDHTNKETLLQLRPDARTLIVAEPAAAKTIHSWHHFNPNKVLPVAKYEARSRADNVLRVPIPPLSADGHAGEIAIAFVPAKNYVTGLHNAFGITYQPPTKSKGWMTNPADQGRMSAAPSSPGKRDMLDMDNATSLNDSHSRIASASHNSSQVDSFQFLSIVTPPEKAQHQPSSSTTTEDFGFFELSLPVTPEPFSIGQHHLPTPPVSPVLSTSTRTSSFSTVSSFRPSLGSKSGKSLAVTQNGGTSEKSVPNQNRSKSVSIIYSPHGIPLADLQPYIKHHLLRLSGALPLTLLLHSFDHAANPWYLGGTIMTGAEGGMEIARALMARCWVSAHDEEKDDRGLATKMLKLKRTGSVEVKDLIRKDAEEEWSCDIRSLHVGECITLSNATKPVFGIEIGKEKESDVVKNSIIAMLQPG